MAPALSGGNRGEVAPTDPAFIVALAGKPDEWKMRAVAGYTTREVLGTMHPASIPHLRQHGLSRASLPSEREAWLFGFEWTDQCSRARGGLLDVLTGRAYRALAWGLLEMGVEVEALGAPEREVTRAVERAARWERLAQLTERGDMVWGRARLRGEHETGDSDGDDGR